jgi:putative molybdopterin biosynthesis protein
LSSLIAEQQGEMATLVPLRHFLTVPETAERLRVSAKTVYRLVWSGQLPAHRIGSQIRIDERELESWLHGVSGRNGDAA